ncbi:hypothetical protein Dsin_003827 [Dipteronia sinensis]|uniref:Ubiquitin-like domain-containing protein n=1 Tax=Dipteronia sinensis TaxID=43782 RepID=A0AAE0B8T7_9ROSI|nr:hypothetical protein Dsin_003827 [Dipteronia sinensis]
MADQHPNEGSSTSNVCGESSDSTVEINIKTLDSRIYSFQVDKSMSVSLFKEKIATDIGVPVGQQRLIFRGKVLKDDHLLSEYHLENGHTLHLVVRQPAQSQPSSDTSAGETNGTTGSRGSDANAGAPRNRVGQISHSVVLGTFNVGDQGEGIVPDLSRVIGAVMNSIGIGGQSAMNSGNFGAQFSTLPNTNDQPPQGNEADGTRRSVGSQSQGGGQAHSGQAFSGPLFQVSPQVGQIPAAAATVPIPSLNVPIPGSLNTLSEFMRSMEATLSQYGYQQSTSSTTHEDVLRTELPTNERGLPTPEALSIVLRHAQRLLSGHTIAALSHLTGRLEQEGASSDPTIRGQIQEESVQVGIAMQHLGSLLLELGRVILTLRMGQSPAESSVNSGPAVYISPSGPNPLMVQPFPLQTSSLFGGPVPSTNAMGFSSVGVGNAPRNINIHIHAGTALAPVVSAVGTRASNGDGVQGELGNNIGSTNSMGTGSIRVLPVRNVIATAVPSRPTGVAISSAAQPGLGISVSQQPPDSTFMSSMVNEINSRLRNLVGNIQGENQVASGEVESSMRNGGSSAGNDAGVSSMVNEINSRLRNLVGNIQGENQVASGEVESSMRNGGSSAGNNAGNEQPNNMAVSRAAELGISSSGFFPESEGQKQPHSECDQVKNNENMRGGLYTNDAASCSVEGSLSSLNGEPIVKSENAPGSIEKKDLSGDANAVPLGLGLGGLERKKRTKQPVALVKSVEGGTSSAPLDQNLNSGQQLLQSLASRSSAMNRMGSNDSSSGQLPMAGRIMENKQSGGQDTDVQLDPGSAMSQVLGSPEINGLLSGFSEQTGVGSPDVLRNMLQQFTQSPQIMNTVNQIAQQFDGQDLGSMFSGLGGGQGGGLDLSRMVQQMMPVVSQALSRGSSAPQHSENRSTGTDNHEDVDFQIGIQQVAQRVEHFDPPEEVFRAIVESAGRLQGNGMSAEDLVNELCSDESLTHEYAEMLQHDLCRRLERDSGGDKY